MLSPLNNTIHEVLEYTWPMMVISIIVIISIRMTYLFKNKIKFVFYKELFALSFIIYILCLFQVVTSQDVVNWSSNNFIPFKEITRYSIGSKLFFKNVLGNMIMFVPYGFFTSFYLKLEKPKSILGLVFIASFSIEIIQLIIGRVFDVDDIILNILGGLTGYFIYKLLMKIAKIKPKLFYSEWFLNIISFLFLIGLIVMI